MSRLLSSPFLVPLGLLVVLAAALLTGRAPSVDPQGRPVVVYAHPPCPPELMALYNPLFDEFRRTHPGIDLRVLHITGNYEDKVKVMFAGNVAPDVIFMYPTALPAWVDLGALEPLDALLARAGTPRSDYFRAMLDTFTYGGRLYGLPKDASATIMEVNLDLFRKYGVAPPRPDWGWNDMLRAARALTRDTDGDGRTDQWGLNPYDWWTFVWQNGGTVLSPDGKHCVLLEPRARQALEFWAALRWKYGVTPTPEAAADLGNLRLFQLGKVAMHFEMYPVVSMLRKTCSFDWDLAPIPRGPYGRVTCAVGSALAVTSQSKHKEAAFEFVHWLTSPAGMRGLVTVESPSCVALARSPAFLESPGLPRSKRVAVDAMTYAHIPIQHPRYAEIIDALTPDLDRAMRGVVTVRQALERAVPVVDRVLRRGSAPH